MSSYLRATFRSLRHRAYRLYFAGQSVSVVGSWMQKVAQALLVLHLTNSGTLLGVTSGLQQLPTLLLTVWAGAVSDRVSRRKILLWTQSASAIPAVALGVLTVTGHVTVLAVMTLAFLLGLVDAFDKPARQVFPIDVVPRVDVANAVVLNNMMFNAGRVVGPAAAGLVISVTGIGVTFLINAASFIAVIAMLLRIRPSDLQPWAPPSHRQRGELRAVFAYVRRTPLILAPLVLMAITGLFAYEWNTSVPLLARTFSENSATVGYFFSAMGAGAIVGGLSLAGALTPSVPRLIGCALVFAVVLGMIALAPKEAVVMVLLFVLGAVSTALRAISSSLLQLESEPRMRGRTVALLITAVNGTSPISGPLVGWVAQEFSTRSAIAMGSVASLVAALGVWFYLSGLRRPTMTGADHTTARTDDVNLT